MNEHPFAYLADKITRAEFDLCPFRHIYIEDFLSPEHFDLLTNDSQIKFPTAQNTKQLVDFAVEQHWQIHDNFPGCITNLDEYLDKLDSGNWQVDQGRLSGQGLALKLKTIHNPIIQQLVDYLNSDNFQQCLLDKFEISRPTKITTSIHKYLSGYEISPHPDIRSKTLTYLVNINTDSRAESLGIHTHLLKLVPKKQFIYDFWKYNTEYDRDWLPWDWCETVKVTNKNNSLILFSPDNDTLHGVKLDYNHLEFQRTQIYGNAFYTDLPGDYFTAPMVSYKEFDIKPKLYKETDPDAQLYPNARRYNYGG